MAFTRNELFPKSLSNGRFSEGDTLTSVNVMAATAINRRKSLVSIYMAITHDMGEGTAEKHSRMVTAL
jgi:hypothetical protein